MKNITTLGKKDIHYFVFKNLFPLFAHTIEQDIYPLGEKVGKPRCSPQVYLQLIFNLKERAKDGQVHHCSAY